MPQVEQSWLDLRAAQEDLLDRKQDAAADRALVESIATGGALAMFDLNSFVDENWRKVILQRTGGSCWVLCDEHGEVLDEPEAGCPRPSSPTSTTSTTRSSSILRKEFRMTKRKMSRMRTTRSSRRTSTCTGRSISAPARSARCARATARTTARSRRTRSCSSKTLGEASTASSGKDTQLRKPPGRLLKTCQTTSSKPTKRRITVHGVLTRRSLAMKRPKIWNVRGCPYLVHRTPRTAPPPRAA